jgi:hypothetical protein
MKLRIIFLLGIAAMLAQMDASAANPRHKRVTQRTSSRTATVADNADGYVPEKADAQSQAAATATDETPTITIVGGGPEEARYEQAKAKAKEDPEVKALKAKADQAATEDEARRTSVAYNQALFRKLRQIDRVDADRASSVEAAVIRRINE